MKSSSLTFLSALILMSCGSIALFVGSGIGALPRNASLFGGALMLVMVAMVGHDAVHRVRKSRVLVPIKTRRNESPRVIRRRNAQW
jgi:hypothetical protein